MIRTYSESELRQFLAQTRPDTVFAIVDRRVASLHETSLSPLQALFPKESILFVSGDESLKSLSQVEHAAKWLNQGKASRKSLLMAIGGGALLDFAGFLAAVYKRGMEVAYMPTTLLAMVDAAVGGKTAVNALGIKNLLGVFREPASIFIEERFLQSLPPSELISGYGELLKYGLLEGEPLWSRLLDFDPLTRCEQLRPFIDVAIAIKIHYVDKDLKDNGIRRHLNLGHTIGHALEAYSNSQENIRSLKHGEAVIFGMICALFISHCRLGFPSRELHRLEDFVKKHINLFSLKCTDYEALLQLIYQDKKTLRKDEISFIALESLGEAREITVSKNELLAALDYFQETLHP